MEKSLLFFGNPYGHGRMDGPPVNNSTHHWKIQNDSDFVPGFVADGKQMNVHQTCATKNK